MERLTLLKLPIDEVYNTIKYQPWVRRPKPLLHNPSLFESEEYCSYDEGKGYQTIHCWALRKYLEELIKQGFLKEYVLTLKATSGHLNIQSPREQNMIMQYKAID